MRSAISLAPLPPDENQMSLLQDLKMLDYRESRELRSKLRAERTSGLSAVSQQIQQLAPRGVSQGLPDECKHRPHPTAVTSKSRDEIVQHIFDGKVRSERWLQFGMEQSSWSSRMRRKTYVKRGQQELNAAE